MRLQSLFLAAFAALCALPAHAIYINRDTFAANGGNLQNIPGTAANVFDKLRTASLASQFNPVGDLGGCTGTWLGTDGHFGWVLTAAHCVPSAVPARQIGHLTFRDGQGRPLAGGAGGWAFLHPYRFNRPAGVSESGTDIAMLKLPLLVPANSTMLPAGAIVNDRMDEVGQRVAMVGHGTAGVGQASVDAWWPTQGARRVWAEVFFDRAHENGYTAVASYLPTNSSTHWARAGVGDGGAAWWQFRGGLWSVVATTSGGSATSTTATRTASYATWIKGLYPAARMRSDIMRVTEGKSYVSPNFAWEAPRGSVYYVVAPGQTGVTGPTMPSGFVPAGPSRLTAQVRNTRTGQTAIIKLRAEKAWCGRWTTMESEARCYGERHGELRLTYAESDNLALPRGQWRGTIDIEARGWHANYYQRLTVDIDVVAGRRARVTRTSAFQMPHYEKEQVYFTVPTGQQPWVTGPNGWYSVRDARTYSEIDVLARNAITQELAWLRLRGARGNLCDGWLAMNNALHCAGVRNSSFRLWFDAKDNAALPKGLWRAQIAIHADHPSDQGFRKLIMVDVEIDTLY